ncbi:MAG TPA: carboxypeptidase-like regulatory domain-containing protein [Longimicrobium sp.]
MFRLIVFRRAACGAVLAAAVLLAGAPARAQSGAGSGVSGRVLDREQGTPVSQAVVTVTSVGSGRSRADTTDAEGRYAVPVPDGGGPFSVRAERLGYRPLTVSISPQEAAAGAVIRDLRLSAAAVQLAPVSLELSGPERERLTRRAPGANEQITHSWSAGTVPLTPGDLAGLAALQGGVHAGEGGVSFFGQDPSQTRTTLDGASFGATSVPQEALASVSLGSTYDVSRGEFSGGVITARTLGGTNRPGAAVRARATPSPLQWELGAPGARGPAPGVHVDAGAGGALVYNRFFWFTAFSASRFAAPFVSLDNASPAALRRLGVDADSALRFAALVRDRGLGGDAPDRTGSTSASGLLRLDYDFTPRHSLMLRLDGRRLDLEGLGTDALGTAASGEAARERAGGVLAQLTSRVGHVENELRLHWARERRGAEPDLRGPAGRVRISAPQDGIGGSAVLRFGGSPFERELDGRRVEVANHATLSAGPAHQVQAGVVLAEERVATETAANAYGTFLFNSLDDFRQDRPSLFTRALGTGERDATTRFAALYLGDTWTGARLRVTAGARLERRAYGSGAEGAAWMDTAFGARAGRVPSHWSISPRLGWGYQKSGWYLIGGVGHFQGALPLSPLASVLGERGGADQAVLSCVGDAAPVPLWELYAEDPDAAPTACADGAAAFAARTSPVTLFAPGFAAPGAWRGSVGGHFPLPRRLRLNFDASLTRGDSQPMATDVNLAAAPLFALAQEGGRPVYASATAIDPSTGGVAADGTRPYPTLGGVRVISGRGSSTVAQVTVDVGYPFPISPRFSASGSYTFTRARDQVGTLPAFGGSVPLAADASPLGRGTSDLERRHDLRMRLTWRPWGWVTVGVLGRLTSGAPFTPRVDGDVNGDGARNDAAFVFDPGAAADPALAAGMAGLLAAAPSGVRACLRGQMGRVARRNSCRGPWSSALDLRADLQVGRGEGQRRLRVSVTTRNALSLVDRLVHGRDGARGWGAAGFVDPVLLRVRGFDPAAGAFRYEVNPGFGTRTAALYGASRPFSITIEGRVPIGADPAYQPLERLLNQTAGPARSREQLRAELASRIPNLAAQVASVDSAAGLGLGAGQRARLLDAAGAFGGRVAPLADSIASLMSDVENGRRRDTPAAWREIDALTRRVHQAIDEDLQVIRQVLTPAQWEKLPAAIREPARQVVPPRGFTSPR